MWSYLNNQLFCHPSEAEFRFCWKGLLDLLVLPLAAPESRFKSGVIVLFWFCSSRTVFQLVFGLLTPSLLLKQALKHTCDSPFVHIFGFEWNVSAADWIVMKWSCAPQVELQKSPGQEFGLWPKTCRTNDVPNSPAGLCLKCLLANVSMLMR